MYIAASSECSDTLVMGLLLELYTLSFNTQATASVATAPAFDLISQQFKVNVLRLVFASGCFEQNSLTTLPH